MVCLQVIMTEALGPISLRVTRYDLLAHRRRVITSKIITEKNFFSIKHVEKNTYL